jgi:integrase/recombinase XerD
MEFEAVVDEFKKERQAADASDRTAQVYARNVRKWSDWLAEEQGKKVWDAETVDLRKYIRQQNAKGKASGTINQHVSAISKFYQDCPKIAEFYDIPEVPENPYSGLDSDDKKPLKTDTKKKQTMDQKGGDQFPYLKPHEVERLVQHVPAPKIRNELIVKLLFRCGFRREELAQTKLAHVDRDDASVFIPPMKSPDPRNVAFDRNYLAPQLGQWLDYGDRDSVYYAGESDYLFPTNEREHITGETINRVVKEAAENAGLQEVSATYSDGREQAKITAHTLRHSFAMQAINSEIQVKTLQTLMGHQNLDTTLIYLQQSKQEAKEASRKFNPTPHK